MRKFDLSVIMSVTTGRLMCKMGDIYEILDYMTGDELYTHALPRASRECAPYLFEQFPFLVELQKEADAQDDTWWHAHYQEFAAAAEEKYGKEHAVRPIHAEDHEVIDPIEELLRMRPDANIFAIGERDDINPTGDVNWKVD